MTDQVAGVLFDAHAPHLAARLLRSSVTPDEGAPSGPRRRTTFLGHLAAESLAALFNTLLARRLKTVAMGA